MRLTFTVSNMPRWIIRSLDKPLPSQDLFSSGTVVWSRYLWAREKGRGRQRGIKERPCLILAHRRTRTGVLIAVLPISHCNRSKEPRVKLPVSLKHPLQMSSDPSWVYIAEGNILSVTVSGVRTAGRIGTLPARFMSSVRGSLRFHLPKTDSSQRDGAQTVRRRLSTAGQKLHPPV